ncbi:phage major capsid protein [Haloactinopolyspora sp.]|uniref:phage major capsid protein n=1 Tax=Haloactinopolyspora sp. TaxID=1966353 RepID=UPI002613E956|nr:phage major capsid protein [Haloactinopolyspora sp.]
MTTRERIQHLLDQRATAWAEMQAIDAAAGAGEGRALTAEEREKWDRIETDISTWSEEIDRLQRMANLDATLSAPVEDRHLNGAYGTTGEDNAAQAAQLERAFGQFLRYGIEDLAPEDRKLVKSQFRAGRENRAQSEGTTTAGGYLVPQGYWERISEVLKAYGGLLGISNVIRTETGQPLPWPNNDDTANVGSILGENTQVTEVDLTVGQRVLNAWTYTSNLVLVSLELLQDSAFDLDVWIPKKLGQRLGRAIAANFATGTGTGQPLGIATSPTVGVTGATGQTLTITYDNIVDLVHSVDPAYRSGGNARFVMADSSLAVIRKITDSYGHPLWQPSVSASDPDFLLGYPLTIDQGIPVMAANAYSVFFGDFEAGYVVRQCLDVQMMRLTERYADYLQVGFFGFLRLDARPDDAHAVKAYQNSAT